MKPRARDPIWDALTEHFGEPRTKSERGRRNRAVKELREAEVSAEEIRITVDYCRRHFVEFTEMAVCGWVSRALQEHSQYVNTTNVIELAARRLQEEGRDRGA